LVCALSEYGFKNASRFHFGVGYPVPGMSMPASFLQFVYHDRGYKVHVLAEESRTLAVVLRRRSTYA
jgi:hypothetical protein